MFDWYLRRELVTSDPASCAWSFSRRWQREVVGMSLRGLVQTVPPGLLLFYYGYGYQYAACGLSMGVLYDLAWRIPSKIDNFEQG